MLIKMMMNKITAADFLSTTGYSNWFDFYSNITGHTLTKNQCIISYKDVQGNKQELDTDLAPIQLERLALEEAKKVLPRIGATSFSEFEMLAKEHKIRRDDRRYYIDVVVITKEDQIILERFQWGIQEV